EARLRRLAGIERQALALVLAHLAEFDRRRLYADRGQPSMFAYCTGVLGYSEHAAYKRIHAARAIREHPVLLELIAAGRLHLCALVLLAPHLRQDNLEELLAAAAGKSKREMEVLVAGLAPRPDTRDILKALPRREPAATSGPRDLLEPLSAYSVLARFTAGLALRDKYLRALDLLGGKRGKGDMARVFEAALDALLDRVDPARRLARRQARELRCAGTGGLEAPQAPRPPAGTPRSRAAPRAVRDAVWSRDGGRCTFVGPDGARCPATTRLNIDHIRPFALGGASDDAGNLRLACAAHNQLLARRVFGAAACAPRPPEP
ncbi:MAG: HNH endonuclease, partial [candidate division NC10 bacterium]|nr:HNH endonuclease [candidate division NC10 bacterium]